MDIMSLLLTIAGLSASFAAILGGFIASRLININSERDFCLNQLNEVRGQLVYYKGLLSIIDKSLSEEDAIRYIHDHMADMMEMKKLEEVYEDAELQKIGFVELEPLWKRAQELMNQFDCCLQDCNGEFNSDMIPIILAEEYSGDIFAYEFCKIYAGCGFYNYDYENTPFRATGEWYERDRQKLLEYTTQIMALENQEEQYLENIKKLRKPKGIKQGIAIFGAFCLLNIICPLSLCLFNYAAQIKFLIGVIAIAILAIGLTCTLGYMIWMLKWKNSNDENSFGNV